MNDQSQGVPAFLSKLWALVEDPGSDYMICWDAVCNVRHQNKFVLPSHIHR